jgi:hypothetical protein
VLGGGVIGVEFASVWKSFGADVTILEALPRLVAAEDEEISKQVERAFRKRKINFKVGKPFEKVEHTENGVRAPSPAARPSRPRCCWSRSAAARRPPTWGTSSRASRSTGAS